MQESRGSFHVGNTHVIDAPKDAGQCGEEKEVRPSCHTPAILSIYQKWVLGKIALGWKVAAIKTTSGIATYLMYNPDPQRCIYSHTVPITTIIALKSKGMIVTVDRGGESLAVLRTEPADPVRNN